MEKLIHKSQLDWKGTLHLLELFEADNIDGLKNIKQVQAIPFIDDGHVVIYKHIDNYYGLPGGTIEEGESFEETLRREIYEESACTVLDFGLIGYLKDTDLSTNEVKYQLRYWVHAELLDEPVKDPDGKAVGREVVKLNTVNSKINWGERGQILLDLATRKFKEHRHKNH